MKRNFLPLICASLTLLCAVCNGTSIQAQACNDFSSVYPVYGMNPPTEYDECDYACSGCGHRGWYHRNFGSNYSFACWCNNFSVCSPCGHHHDRACGYRVAQRGRCQPVSAAYAAACCRPLPNCSAAMSVAAKSQSGVVSQTQATAALAPATNSTAASTRDSKIPGLATKVTKPGV